MIFSYGITYGIAKYAGWEISYLFLLFPALVHTCILWGRRAAKRKKIPIDLFFVLLAAAFFIFVMFPGRENQYWGELVAWYAKWRFRGPIDPVYGWIFLYLLLALAGSVYGAFKRSAAGKLVLSALILAGLIWQAIWGSDWELLPAAALLFVCLDGFTEGYQYFIKKRRELSAAYIFPFLAGTVFLSCILPVSKNPVSWEWAVAAWESVEGTVNEALSRIAYGNEGREFGVGTIGFSEDGGSFWGKLTDGFSREMLEISDDGFSQGRERYFTGIIKDVYEEGAWQWGEAQKMADAFYTDDQEYRFGGDNLTQGRLNEMQWMLAERLHYLYRSGIKSREGERFCRSRSYTIHYKGLRTDALFYPSNCFWLVPPSGVGFFAARDNAFFDEKQKNGDSYQVYGMQINMENEALVEYLRQKGVESKPPENGTLFEECVRTLGLGNTQTAWLKRDETEHRISVRREEIRKRDLQLPKEISEEMRELALRLTEDAQNDYDKAMAVIRYLKEEGGFSYTYSPKEAPEGTDVMHYFLFEGKSGYCTYFATAAVLLCRLADIPARFVEGIVVDYHKSNSGVCPVEGRAAHAWAQVYIDGFGWIDVDASPGYGTEKSDWSEIGAQYQRYEGESEYTVFEEGLSTEEEKNRRERKKQIREEASVFLWFLLISAAVFLILIPIVRGVEKMLYKNALPEKKAEILMRRILEYLRRRCFAMEQGETFRMYKKRLLSQGLIEQGTEKVFDWYEKVRYGGYKPTETEVRRMEEICKEERGRMKKERRAAARAGRLNKRKNRRV